MTLYTFHHIGVSETIWKPVVGFENEYLISNTGLVKSLERMVPYRIKGLFRVKRESILSPAKDGYGYWFVRLSVGDKWAYKKLHQLIIEAFLSPCPPGMQVNHKDGNKENNAISNLEYVTPRQNTQHSKRVLGNKNGNFKLTEKEVHEIRRIYKQRGINQTEVGDMFNIHRGQISRIVNLKSWV